MYMDDIKLFRNTYTGSENIQSGYRVRIWHRKMCQANKKKLKTINDDRNRITKSGKNQNDRRKINFKKFGNIKARHYQTSGYERKT